MPELSLRAESRMERSRWDKGVRSRCVWKQGQSLRGTVWRGTLESREPRLDGEVGRNVQGPHCQTESLSLGGIWKASLLQEEVPALGCCSSCPSHVLLCGGFGMYGQHMLFLLFSLLSYYFVTSNTFPSHLAQVSLY